MTTINLDDRKLISEMTDEFWGVSTEINFISMVHWSGNLQTSE
nr:hypothetical protein [Candidatus Enterovibrio escacola]